MATQQTPLYVDRNGAETLRMGVEWDDVTLAVGRFAFRLDLGNRNVRFTLTRSSDGAVVTHDFIPGANYVSGTMIFWNPPFAMAMQLRTNPKSAVVEGLQSGWSADLALL